MTDDIKDTMEQEVAEYLEEDAEATIKDMEAMVADFDKNEDGK